MSSLQDIDPSSPEVMLTFYRRLYPFKSIFHWLNHEHTPTRLFTHREFAFTLAGDVYLRYNSFGTAEDLKKQVCLLNPTRFEIGPIYSARPKDKKTVRPAAICKRCWGFISAAVHVLDAAIRDQFGYMRLLWVYSGRRGIHLWISDKEAMELTDQERKSLVNWMTVITGGRESGKKLNVRIISKHLPPCLQSAVDYLKLIFTDLILVNQNCFASQSGAEELLEFIPDIKMRQTLHDKWIKDPNRSSESKWEDIKSEVQQLTKNSPQRASLQAAMEDIILYYTYPRLDAEVSKHRNHLLKAPFCIHPKTGRVCVPVDPDEIEHFDPDTVPTVVQLLHELDEVVKSAGQDKEHHSDWEKTSLKPYVDILDKHARTLMDESRQDKRRVDISW
ncbi:prim-pol domain-containing protein [Cyathus striatus]|nr:prim-pol domain-containing protein [Cyathus striatus]